MGAGAESAIVELVRWIANDDVKLHVASKQLADLSLDVFPMNECVRMCLQAGAPIQSCLTRAAVTALAVLPCVLNALKPNVAGVA